MLVSDYAFNGSAEGCYSADEDELSFFSCETCGYAVDVSSVESRFNCITCFEGYEVLVFTSTPVRLICKIMFS